MRTALLASLPLLLAAQNPKEIPTTQKDLQSLAVTIYNDGLALVKDQREVRLPKGELQLAYQEVSAQIRPETALLRNLTSPANFWIVEGIAMYLESLRQEDGFTGYVIKGRRFDIGLPEAYRQTVIDFRNA